MRSGWSDVTQAAAQRTADTDARDAGWGLLRVAMLAQAKDYKEEMFLNINSGGKPLQSGVRP